MIRSCLLTCGMLVAMLGAPMGCETPPRTPYEQYLIEQDRHDTAVGQLRSIGGSVNMTDPGAAVIIRGTTERETRDAIEQLEHIMLLDSVQFVDVELSARNLRPLEGMHLRHLTVSRTPLTPETLTPLFSVTGLRSVHLVDTGAGDAVIEHLEGFDDLEKLTLAYEPITDAGIEQLANLRRLRTLRLVDADVSEEALQELVEVNTRLVIELGDDQVIRGVDATR